LLAAHRGGISKVLIPEENEKDLAEIPDNIKAKLEIIPVRWIDQVLEVALAHQPTPLPKSAEVPADEPKTKVKEKKSNRVRAH
jgi:ATP-dependent Lon protease